MFCQKCRFPFLHVKRAHNFKEIFYRGLIDNGGEVLCGGGASGASVWVRDVGSDPPVG